MLRQLFAAAALFPQNQGLLQEARHRTGPLRLHSQIMLINRRDQHQLILAKGLAHYVLILAVHADKAQIKEPILEPINNSLTVALVHNKINIRMSLTKLR